MLHFYCRSHFSSSCTALNCLQYRSGVGRMYSSKDGQIPTASGLQLAWDNFREELLGIRRCVIAGCAPLIDIDQDMSDVIMPSTPSWQDPIQSESRAYM